MKTQQQLLRQAFQYQGLLESYAYVLLKDWNLSKDAVQEAFIAVSEQWQDIDPERLLPWLKSVTKRRAIDIIRRRKRLLPQDNLTELVDQHFQTYLNIELYEKWRLQQQALESCMKQLRPEALTALQGYYHERKSTENLGREMGRSANSVRLLLHRMRASLRQCLKKARQL